MKLFLKLLNILAQTAIRKYLMETDIFLSGEQIMGNLIFLSNSIHFKPKKNPADFEFISETYPFFLSKKPFILPCW